MKTFAEALLMAIPICDGADTAAKEQAFGQVMEMGRRYRGIAREAAENPSYKALERWLMVNVATGKLPPAVGLFTMFMIGLQVGMEMEKHE